MILRTLLVLAIFAGAISARAAEPAPAPPPAFALGSDAAPAGTIPWQLLLQAKTVQGPDKKFAPVFTREIKALEQRQVKLYGFMMPLEQSREQKRFLLSSYPPHCAFCLQGGPESLVEVIADKPIEFTYEPIVVAGRMAVLEDDVVYYRLSNAAAVRP